MELSKRLTAVVRLVPECDSAADIGTDHGYVPIFLVEQKIMGRVIAMDVNRGPLARAGEHIAQCGLSDRIETRLSDGLSALKAGEADIMIAAGMGGGLITRIMEEGESVVSSLKACILQPQSEIGKVRRYLAAHGLVIEEEDMVGEDGKFYPMMRAVHGEPECYEEYEYLYGKKLLGMRHPVLRKFLLREQTIKESIIVSLHEQEQSDGVRMRLHELSRETDYVRRALKCYG